MRLFVSIGLGVALVSTAAAQVNFGPETYPHFRGMSGLPGGGFGVMPDGSTSLMGAMAISTPVGFSLRDWHGTVGGESLSYTKSFSGINILPRSNSFSSDGVGQIMTGYGGRWGAVSLSYELLSTLLDHAWNVQYELPLPGKGYGVSVGVQDITDHGGAQGEGISPAGHNPTSRSYYAVGTVEISKGLYASLGKGDIRFKNGVFGNASYSVTPRVKLVGEYDTFGWNYCVAYGCGRIKGFLPPGHQIEPILSAGFVGGNRALAMLNFAF